MSIVNDYRKEIAELRGVVQDSPLGNMRDFFDDVLSDDGVTERMEQILAQLKAVYAPLLDGTIDPGDTESVLKKYWATYGDWEIAAVKREVDLHRRLRPLYEHLAGASDDEWAEFAKARVAARIEAEIPLLARILPDLSDAETASS